MRFPSKVTSYKESTIALFPVILIQLEKKDLTPSELYKKVKNKVSVVQEYNRLLLSVYGG